MHVGSSRSLLSPSFIVICFSNLLLFIAFHMITPVMPLYLTQELHAGTTIAGLILAMYTVAAMFVRPFTGLLADVYRGKGFLLLTYGYFALCFLGYILSADLWVLFVVRIVHGIGFSLVGTASFVYAIELMPKDKLGTGIGIFGSTAALSMALGPMLGMFILTSYSYYWVFVGSLCFVTCGFCMALFVRRIPRVSRRNRPVFAWKALLVPSVKYAFFGFIGISFLYGLLLNYVSLFVLEKGMALNAGYIFCCLSIGLVVSRIVAGRFIDKGHVGMTVLVGKVAVLSSFITFVWCQTPEVMLVASGCIGLGCGFIFPTYQTIFTTLALPEERGRANSLFFTSFDLGVGVAILIGGVVADMHSLQGAYSVGIILFVLSFIYFFAKILPDYHQHKVLQ